MAGRIPSFAGAYAVTDVQSLRDDAMVVRAERLADPDDPRAYTGPVSLKLNTDPGSVDAAEVADRLRQVRAIDHPNLGRPIESFLGPGLALDPQGYLALRSRVDGRLIGRVGEQFSWGGPIGLAKDSPMVRELRDRCGSAAIEHVGMLSSTAEFRRRYGV